VPLPQQVFCWYALFIWFLVPYRLVRRWMRSQKRQRLQHRETLALLTAIEHKSDV
jgi:hypothetical protein